MATTAAQDKLKKPLAFEGTEPRGSIVICAQSAWDSHVLKGHPEMAGRLSDVQAAIADPDGIRESTSNDSAQIFEWVCEDTIQIRVVVVYDDITLVESGTTAKVITAFPVDPDEFDKPQVGAFVYTRPTKTNTGEDGEK